MQYCSHINAADGTMAQRNRTAPADCRKKGGKKPCSPFFPQNKGGSLRQDTAAAGWNTKALGDDKSRITKLVRAALMLQGDSQVYPAVFGLSEAIPHFTD